VTKEIPVYLFMGFLESGKTTFAKETLVDRGFTDGKKTLMLVLEEGEEEYDEEDFKKKNIVIEYIDDLDTDELIALQKKHKPEMVMIEYNGTWPLDKLFSIRVPKGWTVVQVISFINAQTFDVYMANMKKMMMDQIQGADMIIFNRCDENTKRNDYRRSLRAINRRAQVIFENMDGIAENGQDDVFIPYDLDAPVVEIEEEDFGIFYIDAADNPDKYAGKKVKFKAMVHRPSNYSSNCFVPGRFAMTCCADDVAFVGFKCYYAGTKNLSDRQWVIVEGTIGKEYYPEFEGDGPVIKADSVVLTAPAAEELVYFN